MPTFQDLILLERPKFLPIYTASEPQKMASPHSHPCENLKSCTSNFFFRSPSIDVCGFLAQVGGII